MYVQTERYARRGHYTLISASVALPYRETARAKFRSFSHRNAVVHLRLHNARGGTNPGFNFNRTKQMYGALEGRGSGFSRLKIN